MVANRSAGSLWIILSRAYKTLEKKDLESIRSLGFKCETDFAVLEILFHKGSLPVNTIGQKILLTSGSITTAIQRLEANGWVAKEVDVQDKRKILVTLTEAGTELISKSYEKHHARLEDLMSCLDLSEKETLALLLKKLGMRD